jgi:integrase
MRGNSIRVSFALASGRIERVQLGDVTIEAAQLKRAEFKEQVRLGTYVKPSVKRQPAAEPAVATVADLIPPYKLDYLNRGGKDWGRLEIAWARLKPMFENVAVTQVTTNAISTYVAARQAQGMTNATVNRELALLKAAFHHGARCTPPMVTTIPAFPRALREAKPRQGFVEPAQYAALIKNCKALWLRTLVTAAFSFGFRKGELLNLQKKHLDLLGRMITLVDTKNGESRLVPMTAELHGLLCQCVSGKDDDGFVFTRENGVPVVDPRDDWYSACLAAGLGKFVQRVREDGSKFQSYVGLQMHDLRRSAIRQMRKHHKIDETTCMKISGHKTASVFRRYNIVTGDDLQNAARLIEDIPPQQSETQPENRVQN